MLLRILIAAILSISVSCFAETDDDKTKPSTDKKSSVTTSSSGTSTTKKNSQSSAVLESDKKPSMVDYCKKHMC